MWSSTRYWWLLLLAAAFTLLVHQRQQNPEELLRVSLHCGLEGGYYPDPLFSDRFLKAAKASSAPRPFFREEPVHLLIDIRNVSEERVRLASDTRELSRNCQLEIVQGPLGFDSSIAAYVLTHPPVKRLRGKRIQGSPLSLNPGELISLEYRLEAQLEPGTYEVRGSYRLKSVETIGSIRFQVLRARTLEDRLEEWYRKGMRQREVLSHPGEAVHDFQELLRLYPNSLVGHAVLAETYEKMGRPDQARLQLEQVQEILKTGRDQIAARTMGDVFKRFREVMVK